MPNWKNTHKKIVPAYEYMPLSGWCLLHQTVYNNKMAFIDFNPPVQVMNILFVWWFYSISINFFINFLARIAYLIAYTGIIISYSFIRNFCIFHKEEMEMKCMMGMQMNANNTYMLCHVTVYWIYSVCL